MLTENVKAWLLNKLDTIEQDAYSKAGELRNLEIQRDTLQHWLNRRKEEKEFILSVFATHQIPYPEFEPPITLPL